MGNGAFTSTDAFYPRGFVRRLQRVPEKNKLDGDAEVDRLVKLYMTGRVNHQSWGYRREVLEAAARLFKNFPFFLDQQRNNSHLYGYNYEFLLDTLRYIVTGRRKLSIQAWKGLMSEHMPPTNDFKSRSMVAVDGKLSSLVNARTADVISKWCSHPGGFEDLLQTLVIMFGRVWEPLHEYVTLHADYFDHNGDLTDARGTVYK